MVTLANKAFDHILRTIRTSVTSYFRWYSTDSLRTSATPGGHYSRPVSPRNAGRHPKKIIDQHNCDSIAVTSSSAPTTTTGVACKQRAESVHDLRKIEQPLPIMKLRPPRDMRTGSRPKKQLLVTRLEHNDGALLAASSRPRAEAGGRNSSNGGKRSSAKSFIQRKLFSKNVEAETEDEFAAKNSTTKRECYVLEELSCIEVVPVEDNQHYERVSL